MALIKCPECGESISDTADQCIHCGYMLNHKKKAFKIDKKMLLIFSIVIAAALIIGGVCVYKNVILPANRYNTAMSDIKQEKYNDALTIFEKLGDYKDSVHQIDEVKEKMAELKVEQTIKNRIHNLEVAQKACSSSDTTLAADGLSILVDSKDQNDSDGLADIATIINKLGLPDSLIEEMTQTNALMGRQTKQFADYEVSWSYHPDNGLDAIFKVVQ